MYIKQLKIRFFSALLHEIEKFSARSYHNEKINKSTTHLNLFKFHSHLMCLFYFSNKLTTTIYNHGQNVIKETPAWCLLSVPWRLITETRQGAIHKSTIKIKIFSNHVTTDDGILKYGCQRGHEILFVNLISLMDWNLEINISYCVLKCIIIRKFIAFYDFIGKYFV